MSKATDFMQTLTTEQLIDAFEMTEVTNAEDIATVRGWIMDELESRNQAAFDAWIDAKPTTGSPRRFFIAGARRAR
jgi:hypothetical protein